MSEFVSRIDVGTGIVGMQRPFVYFGYGLESVPEVMDTILGRSVTTELGVTASKQQLCVQEIDQVPDVPSTPPTLKRWIKMLQLDASVFGGELPVYFAV